MTVHLHIGHSMPGCLPESTPACVDSVGDAWRTWYDEITMALDLVEDDEMFLKIDTARNLTTESDIESAGGAWIRIDGRVYWIAPAEGDQAACELAACDA